MIKPTDQSSMMTHDDVMDRIYNGFLIYWTRLSEFSDRPQGGVIELDPKRNMLRIKVQNFYHYSL